MHRMKKKLMKFLLGFYAVINHYLEEAINEVKNNNAAEEYYLTDIVSIINTKGFKIKTCVVQTMKLKAQILKQS